MKAQGREALATSRSFCRDRMGRRDGACLLWELLPKEYGGAWLDGRTHEMKIAASDFDGTISFHEKGSFLSDSPEAGMQGVEEIHRGFQGQLSAVSNGKFIDVVVSGSDKGSGMERLLECMGWQGMKVFAIGDNLNDLPMLRKFRGFTVESGTMEAKAEAEKVYVSVAEMLRENL